MGGLRLDIDGVKAASIALQKNQERHAIWLTEMREQMKHRISENLAFFKASAGLPENFNETDRLQDDLTQLQQRNPDETPPISTPPS